MLDFTKNNEEFSDVGQTMTAKEVAALFGRTVTTIYTWRDADIIKVFCKPTKNFPIGTNYFYAPAEYD